jgi:hypothetical protein
MRISGTDYSERRHLERDARDLQAMTAEIVGHVPRMRAACATDQDFWFWFTGELDSVRRCARSPEERERLTHFLRSALGSAVIDPHGGHGARGR